MKPTRLYTAAPVGGASTADQIRKQRLKSRLGLAAWALHRYAKGKDTLEITREWVLKVVDADLDIPTLWDLTVEALAADHDDRLPLSNWILFDHVGEGAIAIESDRYLWRLFMIIALNRLSDDAEIPILAPSELAESAAFGEDSVIWRSLKEVQQSPEWSTVLPHTADGPARLRSAIERMVNQQRKRERDRLISEPLDEQKIEQFVQSVEEAYVQEATIRRLCEAARAVTASGIVGPPDQHYGYFKLDPKDLYVRDSRISGEGWGEHYGRGLGHGENALVLNAIFNAATQFDGGPWPGSLRELVRQLTGPGRHDAVLILRGAALGRWSLSQIEGFRPAHTDRKGRAFAGQLDGIDTYVIHDDQAPKAVAIDLARFGKLLRHEATTKLERGVRRISPSGLLVEIEAIDENGAKGLVEREPDLPGRLGAGEENGEALRELQKYVRLRVVESVEYQVLDAAAALQMNIQPRRGAQRTSNS